MQQVQQTLYIPLYGKAYVSQKGMILNDPKAVGIWAKEGFSLKRKSSSKWLAYYMAMRSRVFDDWVRSHLEEDQIILHLGCGLDSRCLRVLTTNHWFDVDLNEVIEVRKNYYQETETYHFISADLNQPSFINDLPKASSCLVVMEGVSMYLSFETIQSLLTQLSQQFEKVSLLMDVYSTFAAKASKYKNPINDVGVTKVYGYDNPNAFSVKRWHFVREHEMTPPSLINELSSYEQLIFKCVYASPLGKSLYHLYEFQTH